MSFITPQDEFEYLQFGALIIWNWADLGANKQYREWCFMLIQTNSLNYMAVPFYQYSKTAAGIANAYEPSIFGQYIQKVNHFNGYRLVLDDSDGTGLTDQEIVDTILGNNIIVPVNVDYNNVDYVVEDLTFGSTLYDDFKPVDSYCNRVSKTNLRAQIRTMVGKDVLNRYRYEQFEGFEGFEQKMMDVRPGYYMDFFSTLSIFLPNAFDIDQALSEALWKDCPHSFMSAIILSERFKQDPSQQVWTETMKAYTSFIPGIDLIGGSENIERSTNRWYYPLQGNVLYEQATLVQPEQPTGFKEAERYLKGYGKILHRMGESASPVSKNRSVKTQQIKPLGAKVIEGVAKLWKW